MKRWTSYERGREAKEDEKRINWHGKKSKQGKERKERGQIQVICLAQKESKKENKSNG